MAECMSDEYFFTAIRQGKVEVVKAVIETRGRSILAQMTHQETLNWPNFISVSQEFCNFWRTARSISLYPYVKLAT